MDEFTQETWRERARRKLGSLAVNPDLDRWMVELEKTRTAGRIKAPGDFLRFPLGGMKKPDVRRAAAALADELAPARGAHAALDRMASALPARVDQWAGSPVSASLSTAAASSV